MNTNERIEALEQQVASLSSALSVLDGDLSYRITILESAGHGRLSEQIFSQPENPKSLV